VGSKNRVAIAGAIARRCEVLLLDEPTALLDPDSQLDGGSSATLSQSGSNCPLGDASLDELNYCDGAFARTRLSGDQESQSALGNV